MRDSPVVFIPTRRVPERAFAVVRALQSANPANEPWALERLLALFDDPQDRSAVEVLVRRGYLEEPAAVSPGSGPELAEAAGRAEAADDRQALQQAFEANDLLHHFARPRAFGLPMEIDDDEADVALLGLPFASLPMSSGCDLAPAVVRRFTTERHLWFDVFASGVLSELGASDGLPEVLCRGVTLKDYGDLGEAGQAGTVGELFAEAQRFVDQTLVARRRPALFIGGDHAITFPLVHALLRHEPELCLIHLDAHHDLLYAERITFSHAAAVSNLVKYSGIKRVISLGVRGPADARAANLERLVSRAAEAERVRLHSIAALKRLLGDPTRLDAVLSAVGARPCYLTLDLDVLTPAAIGGQVSTPSPGGLEWWELIEIVRRVEARCRLIAADVVELNPLRGRAVDADRGMLVTLLLQLVHTLARSRMAVER
jgi:arginase family enzyme